VVIALECGQVGNLVTFSDSKILSAGILGIQLDDAAVRSCQRLWASYCSVVSWSSC